VAPRSCRAFSIPFCAEVHTNNFVIFGHENGQQGFKTATLASIVESLGSTLKISIGNKTIKA